MTLTLGLTLPLGLTLTLTLTLTLPPPPPHPIRRPPDPRPDPPPHPRQDPPPTPGRTPPQLCPPPRVLTDSWGVCRIRTGCSRPPVPPPLSHGPCRLLYTGGSPLLVLDMDTGQTKGLLQLPGTCRAGVVSGAFVYLLVQAPGSGATAVVQVPRGPDPAIAGVVLQSADAGALQRRRMRPLEAGPGACTVAFVAEGARHVLCFRGADLTVWVAPAAAAAAAGPGTAHHFPGAALGLDAVRTSALWRPSGGRRGATLLLGGARAGAWEAVAVALPLNNASRFHALAARVPVPLCGPARPCTAAGGLAVAGDALYMALEQPGGLLMAAVALAPGTEGPSPALIRNTSLEGTRAGETVVDLIADPRTDALFLASHAAGQPGVVYKLRTGTLGPYGLVRLGYRGPPGAGTPEVSVRPRLARLDPFFALSNSRLRSLQCYCCCCCYCCCSCHCRCSCSCFYCCVHCPSHGPLWREAAAVAAAMAAAACC